MGRCLCLDPRINVEHCLADTSVTLASESILPHFAASNRPSAQLQRSSKRLRWASHPEDPETIYGTKAERKHVVQRCQYHAPLQQPAYRSILHSTSVQLLTWLNLICVDPSLSSELSPHLKNCTEKPTYQVGKKKVESSQPKNIQKKRNEQTPFF